MVGNPTLGVGAADVIGFAVQSTFGTPVAIPSNVNNWLEWTTNTLKYNSGRKVGRTGAGFRGTARKKGRGAASTTGGFGMNLQYTQGVGMIAAFFGKDTVTGTYKHLFDNSNGPSLLTLTSQRRGRTYQYTDVVLEEMTISVKSDDWMVDFTVTGGDGSTAINDPTPLLQSDPFLLEWGMVSSVVLPGSVSKASLQNFSVKFKNGNKPRLGAGSFHPTGQAAGQFEVNGSIDVYFDSTASAQAFADEVAGTVVNMGLLIGSGGTIVDIELPSTFSLQGSDFKESLTEPTTFTIPFEVTFPDGPNGATVAITNGISAAYV